MRSSRRAEENLWAAEGYVLESNRQPRRAPIRTRRSAFFFLPALVVAGCGGSVGPGEPAYVETLEVTVGPTLAKCYGVGVRTCMVVNGGLFYDGIEGFEYEAGYDYRLRIGKYDPWGGSEPPQDAGRYAYRLLEQLEKTPAPSTPATLSAGPARVVCTRTDDFCMVLDGAPYDDIVTSFEYEAGYHYTLEADRYADGRYVLGEVVSRTRAAGTEEEIAIDRHRVECDDGYPGYCKVVNGAPYRGEIVGFQPRHEVDYRLRVERFDMFPDGMTGSPNVPAYGYRWLETLEATPGT
ncbi:MAG: DUF4377 domain-containing protein [Gemmatimonadetes bacterium]|nr:DUF4377 domain-containing protein [Candidatus Palauibacter australiensis]